VAFNTLDDNRHPLAHREFKRLRVSRLRQKEIGDFLDCLREVYRTRDINAFGKTIVSNLGRLFASDSTAFSSVDLRTKRIEFTTDLREAYRLPLREIIANLPADHQLPYLPHYLPMTDARAHTISDFMSRRQFHSKGFYSELYRPTKVEAELICPVAVHPQSRIMFVLFHRDRGDFGERDRALLNLLQPHLSQAYWNARAFTNLRNELRMARRLVEVLDCGLVVLSSKGTVRLITEQARKWLQDYFETPRLQSNLLPVTLKEWVVNQQTSLGRRDPVPALLRPLVLARENRKLVIRLILEADQTLLVFDEQRTTVDPTSLEPLGLTRREAEVLSWVAEGKTNSDIGQILGASPLTVKKHLERIFQKVGVENRTAAAAVARSANEQR
jgi:DNA-binding CsgD family transcriptional regulator/GAF domain-containing protein